ncbi:MAG: MBL fold metallo-hydrolase [Desulfobacterales bacterium]|jgi:glyoxylase-like metal-dependent hydrolase (beta-lactamase superfamily II)/rhodanese-related sulfurtransferase
MALQSYSAQDLFEWLTGQESFLLLDVRNDEEFGRFKVEGPYPFEMINAGYMEFIEHEEESVAKVPRGKRVRIVCAKEGSAKFVGEILENHGFEDVGYLLQGIKSWGNLLAPIRVDTDNGYEFYQFRRPGKASCSYGLVCNSEMMIFDPAKNISAYQQFAEKRNLAITRTFETHRQADYISGSKMLSQATGAEIMAPLADFKDARFLYTAVQDGEVYTFTNGGPEVKVIHTPGHTPGSTSYLIDGKYLISGDMVFIISIGRPDLGGMVEEWSKLLFNTMTEKIIPLDDAVEVFPGHYMDWKEANDQLIFTASLGKIKELNAHIYTINNERTFCEFIMENMRPQPEEYAKIREINAGLAEVDEEHQDILDLGKNECAASARQAKL